MIETKLVDKQSPNAATAQDVINIVYYTDPLCCWSWAMEQHWQKLKEKYKDILSVRYCMGGLIESWNSYHDAENAVSKPVQMGPVWMQAGHTAHIAIDSSIWVKDPPASSYLACVAVKCAQMQSTEAGEGLLMLLRKEVMANGRNIAKLSTIMLLSETFKEQHPHFDIAKFADDLVNGNGNKAFSADLQEVRYRNISRFPTLAISNSKGNGVLMTGYRPFEKLMEEIEILRTGR